MMDPHVIAVFEDQDVPVERDVVVAEVDLTGPLRFVVQVEHRTAALNMVIEALDQALRQAFTDILPEPPRRLIEAIVVDNRDSRLLDVRMDGFRSLPKLLTHRS